MIDTSCRVLNFQNLIPVGQPWFVRITNFIRLDFSEPHKRPIVNTYTSDMLYT